MKFKNDKQRKKVMSLLNAKKSYISSNGRILYPYKKDGTYKVVKFDPKLTRKLDKIELLPDYTKLKENQKIRLKKAIIELHHATTDEKVSLWFNEHKSFFRGLGAGLAYPAIAFAQGGTKWKATAAVLLGGGYAISKAGEAGKVGLKTKEAKNLLNNRSNYEGKLIKQGYTRQEAKIITDARIVHLDKR